MCVCARARVCVLYARLTHVLSLVFWKCKVACYFQDVMEQDDTFNKKISCCQALITDGRFYASPIFSLTQKNCRQAFYLTYCFNWMSTNRWKTSTASILKLVKILCLKISNHFVYVVDATCPFAQTALPLTPPIFYRLSRNYFPRPSSVASDKRWPTCPIQLRACSHCLSMISTWVV